MSARRAPQAHSSLLAAGDCIAGTFRFDAVTGKLDWSEELFRIHGYGRGEIVPTLDLFLSHKHPDDRGRGLEIFTRIRHAGGSFFSYDRLIDARMREHRILTTGEGVLDAAGRLSHIDAFVIDLTKMLQRETEQFARAAVTAANASRSTIEQAKGILMGALRIGSEEAFRLLVGHSQHSNIKVARTAADLVALANNAKDPALLDGLIQALHRGPAGRRSGTIGVHGPPGRRPQRSM
ncbi:response regulator receiver protein [Arthrobacter sp. SPG23]|uniref:PAS and ANTAR domain-containing protein n=1 Tax=Arthrobacter sp. SPG23 TaxID=1610703 RepID=UPI0005BBF311|nr:PAS and ANTAR domain-containing protein [Arthrobacter sp. SPG23]KIS29339.1 response regulator receiver protein [Arthrobacter sp. SPG23]